MADDDQVNEAKSDIDAVRDIVGAPDSPPAPPPPAPPPGTLDPIGDIDQQIAQATAKRDAASKKYLDEQAQAQAHWDAGMNDAGTAAQAMARSASMESQYYEGEIDKLQQQKAQQQQMAKQGCSPALITIIAVLGLLAAGFGVKSVILDNNSSSKTSTAAGAASEASSSCDQSGARADRMVFIDCASPAPLDGHWVLVDGLNQPGFDMGVACDTRCQSGRQVTVDKADVTIDISGDKITGGTFKTGYSSTMGDQCTRFDSHVDATASGGADQVNKYGQLIVDGTQTNTNSCDSNLQPVTTKSSFHTSRFYFLSDPNTLTLCYNIDPNTFNACTTVGFSTPPPSGVAATFKRG